jgi:hypothetical protein
MDINELYNHYDYEFLMSTTIERFGQIFVYGVKTNLGYRRFIGFRAQYVMVEEFRFILPLIKLDLHPNTILG